MATYRELQAEIERLQREADIAREVEKAAVIQQIRELIVEYQIYPQELGIRSESTKKTLSGAKPARYRDPVTGETWSGFGRAPRWIAGKTREDFTL